MTKAEIRKAVRQSLEPLSEERRLLAGRLCLKRLEGLGAFREAEGVLLFMSLPDEIPTGPILESWHGRKRLYLPRVNGDSLDIVAYDPARLRPGAFGILEPAGEAVDAGAVDLAIVPGVAFDLHGGRLGRGRGFYDRLLGGFRGVKVGVGYDSQLLRSGRIPMEAHDVGVDAVATDAAAVIIKRLS